jgi:glycerophosphoryl diester phosphodiesterase
MSATPKSYPFFTTNGILTMAHRGGGGLWPQNTLYAFEHAVALGVDVLETDIHSTADGILVLMHDGTVDRTTNGSGPIKDLTLSELKSLDAGYRWTSDSGQTYPYRGMGITVPTLEELLTAFPRMRINIDIKPREPAVVDAFCQILRDHRKLDQVMVGSFHDEQLHRFRENCPQVATAAGVGETRRFYALTKVGLAKRFRPLFQAFQIPEYVSDTHLVTQRFVRAAHRINTQVHVWTVDGLADMQRLLVWGVDGIITDYPDRLLSLLGR